MGDNENSGSVSTLDDNWEMDVTSVLNEVESQKDALMWPKLLGVATKPNPLDDWDNFYNLNNQCVLRNDCRKLAQSLKNKRSVIELESFLTLYCKKRNLDYSKENGWIEILEKILQLDLPKEHEFNVFFAFTTKYIPKDTRQGSQIFDLLRLMLQYHDPQLSNYFDSLHCSAYEYSREWLTTIFASNMSVEVCHALWELYIEVGDPFLIFHLALVVLINAKDAILEIPTTDSEKALEVLSKLTSQFNVEDISDFVQLATYYSEKTPECIRKEFHYVLFGANFDEEVGEIHVNKILCLPIPAIDLLSNEDEISSGKVNFFVIDARSHKDFHQSHFISSFHLDCATIVDEPEKFEVALKSLEAYKTSKRPDDHFLFLGYGDDEKDQYMNMLIAMFIQKARPHVSFVQGGYKKLYEIIVELNKGELLSTHFDEEYEEEKDKKQGWGFMSRMKSAVTNTSSRMKERVEAVVFPIGGESPERVHHVDSKERHGKRYKKQSVFSIEDNSDEESTTSAVDVNPKEEILLSAEFTDTFECKEIFRDGEITGHIALTRTHIYVLHDVLGKKGYVTTKARHALSTVMAVTSRRSIPELLTFKFGYEMNGDTKITAVHKLYIVKAGECAKAVKTAIFALRPLPDQPSSSTTEAEKELSND